MYHLCLTLLINSIQFNSYLRIHPIHHQERVLSTQLCFFSLIICQRLEKSRLFGRSARGDLSTPYLHFPLRHRPSYHRPKLWRSPNSGHEIGYRNSHCYAGATQKGGMVKKTAAKSARERMERGGKWSETQTENGRQFFSSLSMAISFSRGRRSKRCS